MANFVLIIHVVYVAFVIGGWLLIGVGRLASWAWIRNRTFRIVHLCSIGLVAAEALIGVTCPLTSIENALRSHSYDGGFIQYWLHRILFYSAPAYVFTIIYVLFFLAVVATWFAIRPNPPKKLNPRETND